MAYYNRWNYTSPSGYAEVWLDATRNGANVTVNATVKCTFLYSNDFIAYDGEINFNMWRDANHASANIKGYYDRWYATSEWSRTRHCSMTLPWYGNDMVVGFNMTVPPGNSRFSIPYTEITLDVPDYIYPTAPTWCNISPNPCGINEAPIITWGGANAGSSGQLFYDVEVRSSRSNGGWTNWFRISNSQSHTSYQEIILKNMNVDGQTPFIGVKYQYRIRVWDGIHGASGWTNSPELSVGFGSPTPPTKYTTSSDSLRPPYYGFIISWSGATGGAGEITSYILEYKIRYKDHPSWGEWQKMYESPDTSYGFELLEYVHPISSGMYIQFRIKTKNSYGQESDYLYTNSFPIRKDQMWIKVNNNWVRGDVFLKVNGNYQEATPFIKVNNSWRQSD